MTEMPNVSVRAQRLEWVLLVCAAIDLILSTVVDIQSHRIGSLHLFARSGALMVMAGVLIELRYQGFYSQWSLRQHERATGFGGSPIEALPRTYDRKLGIARLFSVTGTLIWAYGDLVL